jgi:chromosome partitioning protein
MADSRANLTKEVAQEVRNFFKDLVFKTEIPRNVRLAECPSFGKPICMYDATSSGAISYENLTKEIMTKCLGSAQTVVETGALL